MTITVPLEPRCVDAPASTNSIPPSAGFTQGATLALPIDNPPSFRELIRFHFIYVC
jgi:hypothetical protein